MQEFRVSFASDRNPLVMHNIRLASPLDAYSQQLKRLNAKRQKTEDDYLAISRVEWEGGLYFDDEIGVYLPASYPQRVMLESAKITKDGTRYKRSVVCMAEDGGARIKLNYDGPTDLDEMWEDERLRDVRMVSVGMSKVLRTRPRFENWSLSFNVAVEESVMDPGVFTEIAERSGRLIGIGEAPEGLRARFDVTVDAAVAA